MGVPVGNGVTCSVTEGVFVITVGVEVLDGETSRVGLFVNDGVGEMVFSAV